MRDEILNADRVRAYADLLDRCYRRRGSGVRSWVCEVCDVEVDTADLGDHLALEHGVYATTCP